MTPPDTRIRCFAPVADPATARVLILGSMPGAASLGANQYYAHPRNQFWSIMGTLVGAHPALPYAERLAMMTRAGLALWDVLSSCERLGSLDSAIDLRSAQANDFAAFLDRHAGIQRVLFNGALAEACFRRDVQPHVRPLDMLKLPSTSPAHAGLSAASKLQAWQAALQPSPIAAVRDRVEYLDTTP